jgi:hypothetical protein
MNDSGKHNYGQTSKAKTEIRESSKPIPHIFPATPPSAQTTSSPNNSGMTDSSPEAKGPSRGQRSNSIVTSESKSVASTPQSRKGKNRAIDLPNAPRSSETIRKESSTQNGFQMRSACKCFPLSPGKRASMQSHSIYTTNQFILTVETLAKEIANDPQFSTPQKTCLTQNQLLEGIFYPEHIQAAKDFWKAVTSSLPEEEHTHSPSTLASSDTNENSLSPGK